MIVVDSSALLAIALHEPEAASFAAALGAEEFHVGWPTLLETNIVLAHRAPTTPLFLDVVLSSANARPTAFDRMHYVAAISAFHKYGKGRHQAQLNFGDCMAYAIAKNLGAPLLFKGEDFAKTDLRIHPASLPG